MKKEKNIKVRKKKLPLKTGEYFIDLIKVNDGIYNIFTSFRRHFLRSFPKEKDPHFFLHTYEYRTTNIRSLIHRYIDLFEYLDINDSMLNKLINAYHYFLNPDSNPTLQKFKIHSERLLKLFKKTDKTVCARLKLLHQIECFRLYEAMKCFGCDSYLATIVMAVSAAEFRLHRIIYQKNKKLYKTYFEKSTLGSIIQLFDPKHYINKKFKSLKSILPDRHKPLIQLLNDYRIFSAHPKPLAISGQMAKIVLSLSFLLLLDKDLQLRN